MPSIITHAAVPLALWCAADRGRIPPRLLAAGVIAAMLPDADVLAFALHIPYADAFGHRGASHSLLFAGVLAAFTPRSWLFLMQAQPKPHSLPCWVQAPWASAQLLHCADTPHKQPSLLVLATPPRCDSQKLLVQLPL